MLCNRCGYEGDPLYVHGHVQCSLCKQVIDDCCQGEQCYNPWNIKSDTSLYEIVKDKNQKG